MNEDLFAPVKSTDHVAAGIGAPLVVEPRRSSWVVVASGALGVAVALEAVVAWAGLL